jgi:hypothetical protein
VSISGSKGCEVSTEGRSQLLVNEVRYTENAYILMTAWSLGNTSRNCENNNEGDRIPVFIKKIFGKRHTKCLCC